MKTSIELKNMRFYAYHGVLAQERIVGNDFVVNLTIEVDFCKAIQSDNVNDTLNYATVFDLVKKEMSLPSNLLEHVAGRIFNAIKTAFPHISSLQVRLAKLHPPVNGEVESAEIRISG